MHGASFEGGVPQDAREGFRPSRFTETFGTNTNQQTNCVDSGVFAILEMAAAARGDTPGASGTEWEFASQDVDRVPGVDDAFNVSGKRSKLALHARWPVRALIPLPP